MLLGRIAAGRYGYGFVEIELDGGVQRSCRLGVRNDSEAGIVLGAVMFILEQTFKSMSRTHPLAYVGAVVEELADPEIGVDNITFFWGGEEMGGEELGAGARGNSEGLGNVCLLSQSPFPLFVA